MKDEMNGVPIEEFFGLRAKMYSILADNYSKKRGKGVPKPVVKHNITHGDYYTTLFEETQTRELLTKLSSKDHEIYTVEQRKIALSCYDDKRWILDDGVGTLAHGHYKIHAINN